ncbi:MAG: DUF4038 domain-containing protein [bacterium]
MPITFTATQHEPFEWSLSGTPAAATATSAPAPQVLDVDVVLTGPAGTFRVPAFWSGGNEWRVRFAAPEPGDYTWRSECRDPSVAGLHGAEGGLHVLPYSGDNPLLVHGPLQASDDRRTLRHADGTPFFWYGDTWWMGFTKRLSWPDGFDELAADRVAKGFTLVQIVAGVYPDMPYGDPRGENEAGLPYDAELERPNPAWWDLADLKVRGLVRHGLLPCIVGCWGYYATVFGVEKMKRHWRNIVARWGAYPVVWCLAGEGAMPYYQSATKEADAASQRSAWTEIGRYVREIDPMHRLVTIHPTQAGREQVDDDSVLDFDMLQTGHDGRVAIGNSVRRIAESRAKDPTMPVVIGEVIYEGIMHESDAEKLRLVWWASMLSGAAGFTYGANGIWQLNEPDNPYGPSPHGATWGNTPWREAAQLPGSRELGHSARFLRRFDWSHMESHPEWIDPPAAADEYHAWYAAGVPGEFRLHYLYRLILPWSKNPRPRIVGLETDRTWTALWFDPRTGAETRIGPIAPDADGSWEIPLTPEMKDYVLAVEAIAG